MMTDKQQIEEMASILCKGTSNEGLCEKCDFKKHEQFGFMYQCRKFDDAEALYNKNYRKVPEGSIIVDKEYLKKELQGLELQVCKATAKDFIFKVESYLGYNDDNETFTKKELLLILAEVAKEQYGVEVE